MITFDGIQNMIKCENCSNNKTIQIECLSPYDFRQYMFNRSFQLKATITRCDLSRPDSFVLMLRYCANLKAIRYESTSLNRIVTDKSHRVIVA